MPSVSKKQHNFMAAVANSPAFAKKVGVPRSVGEDFLKADKGRKFKEGGEMKESKAMVKKEIAAMKRGKAPASVIKHEMAEMKGMKRGGKAMLGSKIRNEKDELKRVGSRMRDAMDEIKRVRKEKAYDEGKMMGMKAGGYTRSADGVAKKGKTKGTMVKMMGGGKC